MTEPSLPVLGERYALGEMIGRGGSADVFRAVDRVLGREVAVKVLREGEPDASDRDRFVREARTLAGLNHPHLVTVLDAGTDGERPFLVMELVPGATLADEVQSGPVEPARVAQVGAQVADALVYVHAAGVVHRDVKPGNVLVRPDGRAWLNDFGIARLVEDSSSHTRSGTAIGSPAYFSPEQVGGGAVSTASDVYSLGLVLLEALTGRRAFTGTVTEAAVARLYRDPDVPESVTEEWARLVRALTAREAAHRPDAIAAAERLRALAGGLPFVEPAGIRPGAPTSTLPPTTETLTGLPADGVTTGDLPVTDGTPVPPPTRTRRRPWLAALAMLAAVGVGGLAATLLDGGGAGDEVQAVPDDVPARVVDDLQDLHDAVEGASQ